MAVVASCPLRFKDGWLADWADYNSALHKFDRVCTNKAFCGSFSSFIHNSFQASRAASR